MFLTIFVNLARIVIVSVGVLVILQSLGISITPLLTALGVGGLAVSLALLVLLAFVPGCAPASTHAILTVWRLRWRCLCRGFTFGRQCRPCPFFYIGWFHWHPNGES